MKPAIRVQDAVHGLLDFFDHETVVVDLLRTTELQRLRRIRQLGLSHLVYPAAEHSRLAHSLGASHIAVRVGRHLERWSRGRYVPALCIDEGVARDFALAALVHDLGHGPLSHTWEREVVGESFDRESWSQSLGLSDEIANTGAAWHELVTQALLLWPDGELHRLLERFEEGTSERIAALLRGTYYLGYLPRLLASDIDVDRADYMLRDAFQTGVPHTFDLDWLISTVGMGETEASELVVGFDRRKARRVIEQFVIARRALYDTVYYHKAVHSAEGMVGLLLRRLKDMTNDDPTALANLEPRRFVRSASGAPLDPSEILDLDDNALWVMVQELERGAVSDETAIDLAQRIRARDLFKMVNVSSAAATNFFVDHDDARQRINHELKAFTRGDPRYYLHRETTSITLLSRHERKCSYFVDPRGVKPAEPVYRDDAFADFWRPSAEQRLRLFVPREAVETVERLIRR